MKPVDKLKTKLAELFQLDQADLDFGIYRIMNFKRDEIVRFLDRDLFPQVEEAFKHYKSSGKAEIQSELDKVVAGVNAAGMDPNQAPKVNELKARLAEDAVDIVALQNEVFSHLYDFFNRYYNDGDFISQRRYKEGVYAIPYEGEEVKLHWANSDQYYIKTSEYFRDYAFRLDDGRRVHLKIAEADIDKDNNKTASGKERRFVLASENPVSVENGELVIRFTYQTIEEKTKQEALNSEAIEAVFNAEGIEEWQSALRKMIKCSDGTEQRLLEKRLSDYTKKNTFDFFIHKNLGAFLRRELDFYIKNEVMYLDDIENERAPRVEQYLSKIKVIRRIAHKIIDFLAQIEDFQKRLWLKKKFVVDTNYCITLDRVPKVLFPEIAANDAQREEWVRLFAIDEIKGDLAGQVDYSQPLSVEFLKTNDKLVLDTRFFDDDFKLRLLSSFDDYDEECDGLLIHSENFQALSLLHERYREQVKCVYIDPPYNSKTTKILYKNDFEHSSWVSLMDSRLALSKRLVCQVGCHIIAIDENEQEVLGCLLSQRFAGHARTCVSVVHNKKGIQGDYFSYCHEFAYFCIPLAMRETHGRLVPESEWAYDNLRKWGRESERSTARNCFYPIHVKDGVIVGFGDVCDEDYHPGPSNVALRGGIVAVYPVDSQGVERKWRYARNSVEGIRRLLRVHMTTGGEIQIHKAKDEKPIKTVWDDSRYIAGDYGTKWLTDLGVKISEDIYPKSIHTVMDSISAVSEKNGLVLDYFGGSGTTGHAVINLNREDDGKRKYILVEMGDYFDTVLKPRIQKVVYATDWKDGKPVSRNTGVSHMFKYMRLESYEDTLSNLRLARTESQEKLLDESHGFRESYMLRYMLDNETKGSPSLLDIDAFDDPFSYRLLIGTGTVGETKSVTIDLVETFNYLIGLRVRHTNTIQGFRIVDGINPRGERVLVIWRKIRDLDNEDPVEVERQRDEANVALDTFFKKQQYNTLDTEYDVIFVNGDNNLMNLPLTPGTSDVEPHYKVRLIEEEFKLLMFDVKDV